MQLEDMVLVSIDDHMIEPPDMYKNHVPAKYADDVPKVIRNDDGRRRVGVPGEQHDHAVRHGGDGRLAAGASGASTPARSPSCGPAASTCTSACAT